MAESHSPGLFIKAVVARIKALDWSRSVPGYSLPATCEARGRGRLETGRCCLWHVGWGAGSFIRLDGLSGNDGGLSGLSVTGISGAQVTSGPNLDILKTNCLRQPRDDQIGQ
jgi:hypothetical protein